MRGLSTSDSISLGWALVAGRKRVPRPAAGNTALRTFATMNFRVAHVRGLTVLFLRRGGFGWSGLRGLRHTRLLVQHDNVDAPIPRAAFFGGVRRHGRYVGVARYRHARAWN